MAEEQREDRSDDGEATQEIVDETIAPKRKIGVAGSISLIVSTMIGTGIFVSPKGVLQASKSAGLTLTVWVSCGLISMLASLAYIELGTMIDMSGGEFAYILTGLGPLLAYLYAWTSIVVTKPASMATASLTFAEYISVIFFDSCGPPVHFVKCLAATTIITITIINCCSVELFIRIQVIFTVVQISALLIIIIGGLVFISKGILNDLPEGFEGSETSPFIIAFAFYDGLYAYNGWNCVNVAIEEVHDPSRTLPWAIYIGVPFVTILFLLTNVSYLAVIRKVDLLAVTTVGGVWADRVLGVASVIIPISVAISTFGSASSTCFTAGRIAYTAGREGHLPEILSNLHVTKKTPILSISLVGFIALLMIILGDISLLIGTYSVAAWFFYGCTFLSLIVMRFTKKNMERPFKIFIVVPVVLLIISIYLVVAPIINHPEIRIIYAPLITTAWLIFYFPFVHFKLNFPYMDEITTFFQLFFEVGPTKHEPFKKEEHKK